MKQIILSFRPNKGVIVIVSLVAIVVLFCMIPPKPEDQGQVPLPKRTPGFKLEQLALASQTLYGKWVEKDVLVDDHEEWSGTTSVIDKHGDRLVLVSNSHCLGFRSLANADSGKGTAPDVKDYQLVVVFPNGVKKPVSKIAETARQLDLALLEVDAAGLGEGVDYIVLRVGVDPYRIGDDVVAVGSPRGLSGTHTFGKISAFRNDNEVKMIQHHADINPGNSGGPLFAKTKADRYVWIGVNTLGGGNGLGFAIDGCEVSKAAYEWVSADKQGAAQLIRTKYGQPNTTIAP
ncbi:MAG: serine protease [Verrucomicrobiota bacterium]